MHYSRLKYFFILFILLIFSELLICQEYIPEPGEIFRDDVIPRIDVMLPPDSLDWILDDQNLQSNYHFHATFIFDNGTIRDTLQNIGFRLRGNTSRSAAKKSFKISFNTYAPGRKYYGLEKMNINGEHNDPTIIRSKICWDMARQAGIIGSRANHVRLYINDEYFGLYINVEHVDEEFVDFRFGNNAGNLYKCLYPADLDYLGSNPDNYKLEVFGRRPYDLKTNETEDDYTQLAAFIDILNNTSTNDLPCELEPVFNVDEYLKFIAFDILTGNWDGPIYNKNNFYLYENPATGLIEYIPYDLDNTLGIDWLGRDWGTRDIYDWGKHGEPRPIYFNILAVPEYRDRFSFYLDKMIAEIFNSNNLDPHIDSLKEMMNSWRLTDPLASLDYGFTFEDYNNSFTDAFGGHVDYGLLPYIGTRIVFALGQLDLQNIMPVVTKIKNNFPSENQEVVITAKVEDDGNVGSVKLFYQVDFQGNMNEVEMLDDGMHSDGAADDGIYGTVLPAFNSSLTLNYFVKATDNSDLENQSPKCGFKEIFIGSSTIPLFINEIMASNNNTIADNAGEYDDWVEIYNGGSSAIYLGDKYLSDNTSLPKKWQMPDLFIQPGEFLLFWADEDGSQGAHHTNFKLNADGEFVGIFDADANGNLLIDGEHFGMQQSDVAHGRIPNGTGAFQSVDPTPGASNEPLTVDHFLKNIDLKIYPNPASQKLNIILNDENQDQWSIQVLDYFGKIFWEENELQNDFFEINLEEKNWSSGIYFIKIKIGERGIFSERFVLQK